MLELALIEFMRGVGFSFVQILEMIIVVIMGYALMALIAWRVRKPIMKMYTAVMTAMAALPRLEKSFTDMAETVSKLEKTLKEHMLHTDSRSAVSDERYAKIEQQNLLMNERITKLESKGD